MKTHRLHFDITINAQPKEIWNALWKDNLYRNWAGVFFEGSYFICDEWKAGNKVFFLGPDHKGIYSSIEAYVPHQSITFKHIGKAEGKNSLPQDSETQTWSGAFECYSIEKSNESHTLKIEIDVMTEHLDFMREKFPQALEVIKSQC